MSRLLRISVVVCAWALLNPNCGTGIAQESKEPPLRYKVQIGDQSQTLVANEEATIEGEFKNPKIKIIPSTFREFPYMGIKFDYPSRFVFEADLSDPTSKNWTLTGNNLNVLLFEMSAEISTVQFANSMIAEFGADNATIGNANIQAKFGNLELPGSQLDLSIGPAKIQMDIFKLPSKAGKTKLVVFQDNIDEKGDHSKEGVSTMKQVKSTFQFLDQ